MNQLPVGASVTVASGTITNVTTAGTPLAPATPYFVVSLAIANLAADSDATAVAAGQVKVKLSRTV